MSKSNGNKSNGKRRDERGLTARMRTALPIIAAARIPKDGLRECVEKKIIAEHTYYHRWNRDARWLAELNSARELHFGKVRDRGHAQATSRVDELLLELGKIALGTKAAPAGQVRAIEDMLLLAGFEEFSRGSNIKLTQINQNEKSEVRESRRERLIEWMDERARS